MVIAIAALVASAAAGPQPVQAVWATEGGGAHVRIASCPEHPARLCGWIVRLRNPRDEHGRPKLDRNNPDPAARNRPVIGLKMLSGFTHKGGNRWGGGTIYDAGSGKTYKSKLELKKDGTLAVSGCVLFICKSQTWHRLP